MKMRRSTTSPLVVLAAGLVVGAIAACASDTGSAATDGANVESITEIQLLSLSDWHGQLESVAVPNVGNIGGAPALAAYFDADRRANPNTLTLSAGDGFGATPPLASFFEEKPAVLALNALKLDADSLGNHNFDRGLEHLSEMIDLATYPFVSANLANAATALTCRKATPCVRPYIIKEVAGIKVAIIGVTNPDAATLLKPGTLGPIQVTDPAAAVMRARDAAKYEGAQVFVVLAHMGATGVDAQGAQVGPAIDFAKQLTGIDVVLADHTNVPFQKVVGSALVVENKSSGGTYARVKLKVDKHTGVVDKTAELVTPLESAVTPDPAIIELLRPFKEQLSARFDSVQAVATGLFERGNNVERLHEVPLGDLVTDSMRVKYGTEIAMVNGGGLRASIPSSYNPADHMLKRPAEGYVALLPFDIVVGDAFAVLPFGNAVITRTITGEQLWKMLEHSVEALPQANGWFAQLSGLKLAFDSRKPVGQRVLSITLDDGTAIPSSPSVTLTLATSDFVATGGDGYTMLADGIGVTRDKIADVLLEHITRLKTLAPVAQGRITDVATP